jgi:hypothetical protein
MGFQMNIDQIAGFLGYNLSGCLCDWKNLINRQENKSFSRKQASETSKIEIHSGDSLISERRSFLGPPSGLRFHLEGVRLEIEFDRFHLKCQQKKPDT